MSKQPPTLTYCKRNRPLPYYHPNCRTPQHWKFFQDHRTTRPSPLDRNSLQKPYFIFIRSILEYADTVWVNCTQQQNNELKNQLEAARIFTGTTKLISINKLYTEVGWLQLPERRNLNNLHHFFKIQNGLTPLYLTNVFPP